jgi:hypothetical protein
MNSHRRHGQIHKAIAMLALVCLLGLASCIQRKPERLARKQSPVSAQLAEMVAQQETLLGDTNIAVQELNQVLDGFRHEVYSLVSQALIRESEDLYRAALILQHADRTGSAEGCLLAHYLALQAADKGYEGGRFLAAACLDRYLATLGRPQRFGTQHFTDSLGDYRLLPVNPMTTDSERVEWDVPPLEQLKRDLRPGTKR